MKGWKASFAALAMALMVADSGLGLVSRWDFDMGGLTQDEAMTALGLQGLMNRNGPYLYYLISNHPQIYGPHYSHLWSPADAEWRAWYMSPPRSFSFTRINTFADLLDLYKTQVNSNLVVYDPQVKGEEAVGATYGGVYTCLPVSGAVLNRTTPGSKKMAGWVEDHFASTEAWRIMKCKYIPSSPKADTSLVPPGGDGECGFSGIQPGDDVLRMWGNSQTEWVAAWLYGVTVETNTYNKIKIRVDSLSQGTGVVVKLVTIRNDSVKAYEFSPVIYYPDTGIKTLTLNTLPGSNEEPYYFEINAFGAGIDKKVRIDWVYSADGSGVRAKRNCVNEEFSDTLRWQITNVNDSIYRRGDLSHAVKLTKASGDSGWITQAGDTVDLDIFPKIQIKVDSLSTTGVQWKLTAKNGNTEYILQNWSSGTGIYTYDLKAISGLTDKKTFDFRIKVKRSSGTNKKVVVNWLRSLTVPLTSSGWTKVKDLRTVAEQRKFPMQQWARDSLLSHTTSSHKAMSGNNGLNTYVGVDYLVQRQGYVFRLDNEKRYEPNNEQRLMGEILDALYGVSVHEPVATYGYLDKDTVINGQYNTEDKYFTYLTQLGAYAMVTPAPNLSFHSQVQPVVYSQRHLPRLTLNTSKHYVALMLSEGDTPKFAFSFFGGSWKRDAAKGSIPFNWGINPVFAEVCPSILEYYYSTNQSDSNYFFAGCSGVGAALPVFFPSGKLEDYSNLFERVGPPADISIPDIWRADQSRTTNPPPYSNINIRTYATEASNSKGFTVMQEYRPPNPTADIPWGHVSFVRDTVPVVRVFKSFFYWKSLYDTIAFKHGWKRHMGWTYADTVDRSFAQEKTLWDSISPYGSETDKLSKWQMVSAERCTQEAGRHRPPFFFGIFSDPYPDSQAVTAMRGVRDSLERIAPGKFVFVTLEQLMDLAKQARLLGSVEINHNAKFTNSLTCTLHLWSYADSMKLWDEDTATAWMPFKGESDTLWTFRNQGVHWINVLYKVGQTVFPDTARDSIIVDASAPYTYITSPVDSQVVGLGQSVPFIGWSYDFEDHDSLWEIWENLFPWASGNNKVGENPWFGMPDTFGSWTSYGVGWHGHSLVTNDSATNTDTAVVHVYVTDPTGDGDGFASGFGSFGSSPVNVATDKKGNLIVAETQGSTLRAFSSKKDTLFSFSARRGNDTTGLAWPAALSLKDSTILWVADGLNDCIKKFDRQGNLLLRFGSHGSDSGHFDQPCGIALDGKNRLWIVDRRND